jgi:quercetin dioxygenase-like cupin family protein
MQQREAELIKVGQLELRFLFTEAETGGALTLFEMTVPPGARVPGSHFHVEVDEAVYGLEGVLTYTIEGQKNQIGPGDRVFAPRGKVHHFVNDGAVPAKVLSVLTPGSIGPAYFRDIAAVVSAGGPPDPAKIAAVMARHGLVAAPMPGGSP